MKKTSDESFRTLDKISLGALSIIENDPVLFGQRIREYNRILDNILRSNIAKDDTPEIVAEKVRYTISELKQRHNMIGDADQLKTLDRLVKISNGKFSSSKQAAYFKANIANAGAPFSGTDNAFQVPMVNYKIDSDMGVVYESYRFGAQNRNFGYRYFFIDDKGVRLVVEHKLVYKRINVPKNHGFSKERPWHTRARRNEMNAGVEKFDENLFSDEKVTFERKL